MMAPTLYEIKERYTGDLKTIIEDPDFQDYLPRAESWSIDLSKGFSEALDSIVVKIKERKISVGTNYYLEQEGMSTLHIGKNSGNWAFALRVYPEIGIHGIDDWWKLFCKGTIINQYQTRKSAIEMFEIIVDKPPIDPITNAKAKELGYASIREFLSYNDAIIGYKGYLFDAECQIESPLATWYLVDYDFS